MKTSPLTRGFVQFCIFCSLCLAILPVAVSARSDDDPGDDDYRWNGYDFVFVFVSDDGKLSNLAWADVARSMDFRFTIAANTAYSGGTALTGEQLHQLWADGFEIGNHGYSHGEYGLDSSCPSPPKGSLAGYFLCDGLDPGQAMIDFTREIERDSVAVIADIPLSDVRSLAYPRHRHTVAIIDALIAEGYLGARMGSEWSEELYSYGDFTTRPSNSWDDGISLFRVPVMVSSASLFGDHSATPPVHKTHEEFLAIAQPWINSVRSRGGVFALYDHHLGDDDDSLGDINYGSGGVSTQDLTWIVELVRENGGTIMTFGEMCAYYRERTTMVQVGADYVWRPGLSGVEDLPAPGQLVIRSYPNPFNPLTVVTFALPEAAPVEAGIYDLAGRLIRIVDRDYYPAGEHQLNWDGRDQAGQSVAAGSYFFRLTTDRLAQNHKLLLLK